MLVAPTLLGRVSVALIFSLVVFSAVHRARGETPVRSAAEPVDLFTALEQKSIAVDVFALDSKAVNLQIHNRTDRPLTIKMPAALAAAPVLTQQPFGQLLGQNNNQVGNSNNGGNQAVGIGGPQNNNNNRNGNANANPGFFNVPAEKVIKLRLTAVCLEHGKREPNARLKYELKPLAEVCDDPRIETVVSALGRGEVRQSIAQLAAWNIANGKSWDELAAQKTEHITGLSSPMFPLRDVTAARDWVKVISPQEPARQSLSSR